MENKLEQVEAYYDALVVGGGITGAGILRELSAHGLKTLLVEKKGFSSQTSSRSSKMLHGGLRYLENFDFLLVKEALHEKNLWLKNAPHLVSELAFLLPVYKKSQRPLWMIKAGLFLYDFLSKFKNKPHKILNQSELCSIMPGLNFKNLLGAGLYHDAIVDDKKMAIDIILEATSMPQVHSLEFTSLEDFIKNEDGTYECLIQDEQTKLRKFVKTRHLIFALGPFTDQVLSQYKVLNWEPIIIPSKGVHLKIKKDSLDLKHALLMTPSDKRVIFVIPHNDYILVGTTETAADQDFYQVRANEKEITYLLDSLNSYFPGAQITREHILSTYAGIRPLIKDSLDLGSISREHKIYQPFKNVHIIAGGKYTTFRTMAKDLVQPILRDYKISYNESYSLKPIAYTKPKS